MAETWGEKQEIIDVEPVKSEIIDIEEGLTDIEPGKPYARPTNLFSAKKTVAQGMMDIALITANANQLRFIIEYNQESPTYIPALVLIGISLILQLTVGIFLIFKGKYDLKGEDKIRHANIMNNYVVGGVFLITIVNVFVAAFSMNPASPIRNTNGQGPVQFQGPVQGTE